MNDIKINKEHIIKLIEFLHQEVLSSGGDGDALWYTKYYSLEDLKDSFKEYSDDNAIRWKVEDDSKNPKETFHWGDNQEWVTVTVSKELFDKSPDWQQIKIRY